MSTFACKSANRCILSDSTLTQNKPFSFMLRDTLLFNVSLSPTLSVAQQPILNKNEEKVLYIPAQFTSWALEHFAGR